MLLERGLSKLAANNHLLAILYHDINDEPLLDVVGGHPCGSRLRTIVAVETSQGEPYMIPRALDVILMAQALSEFHGVDGMTGGGNTDQASKWPDEDQALFQDQAE